MLRRLGGYALWLLMIDLLSVFLICTWFAVRLSYYIVEKGHTKSRVKNGGMIWRDFRGLHMSVSQPGGVM